MKWSAEQLLEGTKESDTINSTEQTKKGPQTMRPTHLVIKIQANFLGL